MSGLFLRPRFNHVEKCVVRNATYIEYVRIVEAVRVNSVNHPNGPRRYGVGKSGIGLHACEERRVGPTLSNR